MGGFDWCHCYLLDLGEPLVWAAPVHLCHPLALERHVGLVLLYHLWGPADLYQPWGLVNLCHL